LSFPARVTIAFALSTALLGGCASIEADRSHTSSFIASGLPTWAGGEPGRLPARPAAEPAYPAINAPVPQREAKPLTAEEQSQAIADLVAARNRAVAQAKAAHRDEDIASDEGLALARGKYAGEAKPNSN
jgi:hypothetical protein